MLTNLKFNKRKKKILTYFYIFLFIIAFFGIIAFLWSIDYWNYKEYIVTELSIVQDNDKTLYSCITIDSEELLLENEDLIWIGKTNSSDLAATLKKYEGKCALKIKTRGFRIKLFNCYQNICSIEFAPEYQIVYEVDNA